MEGSKVKVGLDEPRMAKGSELLVCEGVGSGIVLCLFDPKKQIGAMAHVLLKGTPADGDLPKFRYSDVAVQALLEFAGLAPESTMAVLVGGAHMFAPTDFSAGGAIADAMRNELSNLAIPILLDETGGTVNRSVQVSISRSQIEIRDFAKAQPTLCELRAA